MSNEKNNNLKKSLESMTPKSANDFVDAQKQLDDSSKFGGYVAKDSETEKSHMIKLATSGLASPFKRDGELQNELVNEYMSAPIYKTLLGDKAPNVHLVSTSDSNEEEKKSKANKIAISSEFLDDFQTFKEFSEGFSDRKEAMKAINGVEDVVAAAQLVGDEDINEGNLGVVTENKIDENGQEKTYYTAAKIDHGKALRDINEEMDKSAISYMLDEDVNGKQYQDLELDSEKLAAAFDRASKIDPAELEEMINARSEEFSKELDSINQRISKTPQQQMASSGEIGADNNSETSSDSGSEAESELEEFSLEQDRENDKEKSSEAKSEISSVCEEGVQDFPVEEKAAETKEVGSEASSEISSVGEEGVQDFLEEEKALGSNEVGSESSSDSSTAQEEELEDFLASDEFAAQVNEATERANDARQSDSSSEITDGEFENFLESEEEIEKGEFGMEESYGGSLSSDFSLTRASYNNHSNKMSAASGSDPNIDNLNISPVNPGAGGLDNIPESAKFEDGKTQDNSVTGIAGEDEIEVDVESYTSSSSESEKSRISGQGTSAREAADQLGETKIADQQSLRQVLEKEADRTSEVSKASLMDKIEKHKERIVGNSEKIDLEKQAEAQKPEHEQKASNELTKERRGNLNVMSELAENAKVASKFESKINKHNMEALKDPIKYAKDKGKQIEGMKPEEYRDKNMKKKNLTEKQEALDSSKGEGKHVAGLKNKRAKEKDSNISSGIIK